MTKCVILQPSYIPWRGFFHQIYLADIFIFYDDVKFDKNGWRNRNRIKTPQGIKWLTIPVYTKGVERNHTPINQIEISWDRNWTESHWNTLKMAYHKAPCFDQYANWLSDTYSQHPVHLADFTIKLTVEISNRLGINHVNFLRASQLGEVPGTKTERLINILKKVGADHYISGPSARDYIETELFEEANIQLEYMVYDYPPYEQLYPPYEAQVSILDLMFMKGQDTLDFIR